jgi:hypothetical protein
MYVCIVWSLDRSCLLKYSDCEYFVFDWKWEERCVSVLIDVTA